MSRKVTEENIELIKRLKDDLGIAEEVVHDRITYIWQAVCKAFGSELDTWYFDGAEEGEVGDFLNSYSPYYAKAVMYVVVERSCGMSNDMTILDKDGGEFDFSGGEFPTRWLFEDFEDELTNGIRLYKEKQAQDKIKVNCIYTEEVAE